MPHHPFVYLLPEGTGNKSPAFTGEPTFGEPSAFHVNCWARGERPRPQPMPAALLAWYKIQSWTPSADLKKELCPGAKTLSAAAVLNTGSMALCHKLESSNLRLPVKVSI